MTHLSPAEAVIRAWGGTRATARRFGVDPSTVHYWSLPKAKKGTGGLIPSNRHLTILAAAKKDGKREITPIVLMYGLDVDTEALEKSVEDA